MIILNPMGSTNGGYLHYGGVYDYNVTYAFASSIAAYLRLRGEDCILTRYTSESIRGIAYNSFIVNNAPDIIINLKCLSDLHPFAQGYTIECDVYSALAATISAEFKKVGLTPVYPLGYKVESAKTSAKYTEITIGIGYLTNEEDFAKLSSNLFLDNLAKHIVDASYGPPTKVMQPSDAVYVKDPYMYDTSSWVEDTNGKLLTDSGSIIEDLITNIPVRVLKLITAGRSSPYTFHTDVEVVGAESPESTYTVIISYKMGRGSGYVKVGSNEQSIAYEDAAWHRLVFDYSYNTGDQLFLGANANTNISYTAVWVTNSGVIGNIDDPLKSYSTFPPGYRPVTAIDPTAIKDGIGGVLTNANSLISRAQDNIVPNINLVLKESLSMLDQLSISPKSYTDGLKGIMSQITGLLKDGVTKQQVIVPTVPPVPKASDFLALPTIQLPHTSTYPLPTLPGIPSLPPFPVLPDVKLPGMPDVTGLIKPNQLGLLNTASIVPKFAALENTVKSMNRADKRADMLNVVNTMKGTSLAAAHLNETYESKLAAAKKRAEQIQYRTEVKGEAMSAP